MPQKVPNSRPKLLIFMIVGGFGWREMSNSGGRVGRRLLGCGYVLFCWRTAGRTTQAQFEPLQQRIRRALEEGSITQRAAAEQALRGIVLKRNISGPTRSRRDDDFIACGFSAYEPCRRWGRDLIDCLHSAVVAWIDKTAPPSMMLQPTG